MAEDAKKKHEAYMRQQSDLMAKQLERQKRKRKKMELRKLKEVRCKGAFCVLFQSKCRSRTVKR